MKRVILPNKYASEVTHYVFDFTPLLPGGATLSGTPGVTIGVYMGTDATPQAMLVTGTGAPAISGNFVTCLLKNGVAGVIYTLNVSVLDSIYGTLQMQGFVAVLPNQP